MGYRTPSPDFRSASRNPDQLENVLRDIHQTLAKLEKRTSTESVSSQQRAPISGRPPRAGFRVVGTAGKGHLQVHITNPEFGNQAGTGKHTPKPLWHRVSYSEDSSFKTGVTTLPPSAQTYFPLIGEPNQTLHLKLESSHDGVNWNLPQYQQAKI